MPFLTFIRWGVILVLLGSILWVINQLAAQAGGWVPHAVTHLTGAVVGMLPLSLGLWHMRQTERQAERGSRRSLRVFTAGAALFTLGQVVETASAVIEFPDAGNLHAISGVATIIGLLILFIGGLMLLFTAVTGRRLPRWTLALAVLGGGFLLVAAVFGIG